MYFVGFNVPNNCSMEDPVEDLILKMKLNNDRDLWDEQCWGFYDEIDLKLFREEIFLDVDEDGIQSNIKSNNPHIKEFVECLQSLTNRLGRLNCIAPSAMVVGLDFGAVIECYPRTYRQSRNV